MESLLTIVEWVAGRWLERRAAVLLLVEDALPTARLVCGAELLYRREPGARGLPKMRYWLKRGRSEVRLGLRRRWDGSKVKRTDMRGVDGVMRGQDRFGLLDWDRIWMPKARVHEGERVKCTGVW